MKSDFLHFDESHGGPEIIEELFKLLAKYKLSDDVTRAIYRCGTEIIMNTFSHAYPENYRLKHKHSLSILLEKNGALLDIIFQDYGATIPVTVINKIPSFAASFKPSKILKMTVNGEIELPAHRGKGLPSILREVNDHYISNLTIVSGEAFLKITKEDGLTYDEVKPKAMGTKITLSVEKLNSDEEVKTSLINVKTVLGLHPFGRYRNEGRGSGEELRDDYLIPALNNYDLVNIELDGVMGYGSSFLEEVFGGLVRNGFDDENLIYRINIITEHKYLINEIHKYIKEAQSGSR